MSFKKPNITAPRCRSLRKGILCEKFYESFKDKHPKHEAVSNAELRNIINIFNKTLWANVVENRDGVEFPEGMGYIFIGACPAPKKKNIDFQNSIKYGTAVKHRNLGSDNFLAKIFYTNFANKYKFLHRQIWKFKAVRAFSRATSHAFKDNWTNYLKVDDFIRVSHAINQSNKINFAKNKQKEIPKDYNEFLLN